MVSLYRVVDGVITFLSKIHPVWLRTSLFTLLFHFYSYLVRCKTVLSQFLLPVFIVTGKKKDTDESIQFLFVGRENFPLFLVDLLFDYNPKIDQVDSIFVWQLHKLQQFSFKGDAILVSVDRFYERWLRKNDFFVFPHMLDMVLEISEPVDVFYKKLSNSAKADIRKVRNRGFSYEIISNINLLRFFYDSMYLPLIKNRFADKPLYTPPFSFFVILHNVGYKLLLIRDVNGDFVSGCYFETTKTEVFSRYNGVVNGDVKLIKKGVESALYYFLIDWAKKNGFDTVDLGYCRPFESDGVFRYKRKWGTKMRRSPGPHTPDVFGMKIMKKESELHNFFEKNTLIGIGKNNEFVEYK